MLNGSDQTGEAGKTIAKLQLRGFGPGEVGNAPAPAPRRWCGTRPGALAKAELVARYLGGVGQLIEDPSVTDVDVVLVIGTDWRGVHGKGKAVDGALDHLDDRGQDLEHHGEGPEARRRRRARLLRPVADRAGCRGSTRRRDERRVRRPAP